MPTILCLDIGDRRIGVARGESGGMLASRVETYVRRDTAADIEHIQNLMQTNSSDLLVVGLPINMDGSEGEQADKVHGFASRLVESGLIVELWDERLTTVEATRRLKEAGKRPHEIAALVDEVAAVLILEEYMRAHPLT